LDLQQAEILVWDVEWILVTKVSHDEINGFPIHELNSSDTITQVSLSLPQNRQHIIERPAAQQHHVLVLGERATQHCTLGDDAQCALRSNK